MMPVTPIQNRDIAPGTEPIALYNEDGTVWRVLDLDTRLVDAIRAQGCDPSALCVELLMEHLTAKGYLFE